MLMLIGNVALLHHRRVCYFAEAAFAAVPRLIYFMRHSAWGRTREPAVMHCFGDNCRWRGDKEDHQASSRYFTGPDAASSSWQSDVND